MIFYSNTKASEFLRWRGSVAPKCLVWALPCSMLTIVCQFAMQHSEQMVLLLADPSVSETTGWTLFTGILGFLLVFRAQLSYNRYWERLTLFERGCGAWLNASSNLIAFCSAAVDKQQEVDDFQYLLSRYMSLLVSCSMSDISGLGLENFPTLSLDCVDPSTLRYLGKTSAQQNVLLQWVQRLVVDSARAGVIDIPTPILTRAFQERHVLLGVSSLALGFLVPRSHADVRPSRSGGGHSQSAEPPPHRLGRKSASGAPPCGLGGCSRSPRGGSTSPRDALEEMPSAQRRGNVGEALAASGAGHCHMVKLTLTRACAPFPFAAPRVQLSSSA